MAKLFAALFSLLLSGTPLAQSADVGLVNLVSGGVSFSPAAGGAALALPAFSKVRDGDRIEVSPGARVRIVFFDGARQELWAGPASFVARKGGAAPVSGKPMETTTLPAEVPQRIARVPELVQLARLGGIQVRGGITRAQKASLDQQESVAKARAAYDAMRKDAAADDITPELFLYAALHDYLLYDEMKAAVDEMLRRQPASDDARTLDSFVRGQLARRK